MTDRDGDPITFDGCECDLNYTCRDATCQMLRDLEARDHQRIYKGAVLAGLIERSER